MRPIAEKLRPIVAMLALLPWTACAYDFTDSPDASPNDGGSTTYEPSESCVPGQTAFCPCGDAPQGIQRCEADGQFGACDCSGTADASTPDAGVDAPEAPDVWTPTCESERYWSDYEDDGRPRGSRTMAPGQNCITCHTESRNGPTFTVAGTVFSSLHDEDDCYGVEGAVVRIVAADGRRIDLTTNGAGNFFRETDRGPIAVPFTASVLYEDGERAMITPQTDLNCPTCHTVGGESGAPGRIVIP